MKIIRHDSWIKIVNEDGSFVEAITPDYHPEKDIREVVQESIKDQERYIKRLQKRLEFIKNSLK